MEFVASKLHKFTALAITLSLYLQPSFSSNSFSNNSSLPAKSSSSSSPGLSVSHQVGIGILTVALILGFPGNLFVVWTVLCRVRRRSVTCILVLNLASADALVLLTAPLFLRFLTAGVHGWEFGGAACKTVHYLCAVNMYASIYLIALMSADRWLATSRPFVSQRLRTKRALMAIILALWVLAFLMALPMPFYRSNLQILRHKNISSFFCVPFHWNSVRHEAFQYLTETLLGFLLPFVLIAGCYSSVFRRLRSAMFQGRGRGNCLILLILAAFAVFWLPYHIINILQVIGLLNDWEWGNSHIRNAGLGFMARLFEGTNSDGTSRSSRTSRSSVPDESSAFHKLSRKLTGRGGGGRGGRGESVTINEEDTKKIAELKTLMAVAE
ncbi:hypothetical protein AALO_G00300570 [Alosa alosa]|uniref:G-protein coupled receptors family 1 profile domain-containing protein n=1 Tax=Alosa alosa TaxID=278164 RepID=A0AAV6FEE4_9TELE|nr:hypothetical protein AALO_G00300570 [Alosa alosa]